MKEFLENLLVLQDRDSRLSRLNAELARIPLENGELDRQEKTAKEAVDQGKTEFMRIEADRKKIEVNVNAKQELVRKYKTQLLEIKNNEQFHALQHEIATAEGEIRQMEDQELELMEKVEKVKASIKETEGRFKEVSQRIETQRKDLEQKRLNIEKQHSELQAERQNLASGVDEDLLSRYERIFKSKEGIAISRISHGLCTGCNLKITAQEIHHAHGGTDLVTCTNCGRILYWVPE